MFIGLGSWICHASSVWQWYLGASINNLKHGMSCITTSNIFQTSHYQYSHKHQPSSHFVFTCNLTSLVHRSHGLHAVTSSCSPHLPWLRCALSCVHAECPSSFTYVGHLNELQPTITNSQHNCRSPTLLRCYSSTTMQFLTPILRILHGSGETERSLYRLSLLYYLRAGTLTVWTVSIWDNPR